MADAGVGRLVAQISNHIPLVAFFRRNDAVGDEPIHTPLERRPGRASSGSGLLVGRATCLLVAMQDRGVGDTAGDQFETRNPLDPHQPAEFIRIERDGST
jgi:hypothetical protein